MFNHQQAFLRKQIEIVFNQIKEELSYLPSGTVFVQIRNNVVGKFGVRHDYYDNVPGGAMVVRDGLNEVQWNSFRQMAIDSLQLKKNWTHGEIIYDFAMKRGVLCTSVQMESNYNMANLMNKI